MRVRDFIRKLNWRHILVHFVAFWFFIYAFQTLSYLHDPDGIKQLSDKNTQAHGLTNLELWENISGQAGLVVGFIISITISIKRHWFWINSFIAFVLIYFLFKFNLLGWPHLKNFFWSLGRKLNPSSIEFLFNGIVLLTIGLLIFFLKGLNRFVDKNYMANP